MENDELKNDTQSIFQSPAYDSWGNRTPGTTSTGLHVTITPTSL